MENLGHLQETVEDVFGPQARDLLGVVEEASQALTTMQEQFEATVGDSSHETVLAIRGQLESMLRGLGSIATTIEAAKQAGNAFLEESIGS